MTIEEKCVFKLVFQVDNHRWEDVDINGCHECDGHNTDCNFYAPAYLRDEAMEREIAELKERAREPRDYKINKWGNVCAQSHVNTTLAH